MVKRQGENEMNLSTIAVAPHAQGFIKVACDNDPMFGEPRTKNEFLITLRHHQSDENQASLMPHPIGEKLAKQGEGEPQPITEIPIRLFFNKPANALSIKYQAYATPGNTPVCAGNGKTARRLVLAGDNTPTIQELPCPGPDLCDLVQQGKAACRRQVRMAVQIEGQDDPLSVFEVRTSSLNTYRALSAQLNLVDKRFGGLRHVPLKLTLWKASNEASSYQPFSLMQLQLDAKNEIEAMNIAKQKRQELQEVGIVDDVDSMMAEASAEDEFTAASLDFQAVSEFYADATRRPGSEAINSTSRAARAQASGPLMTAANNAIANAVKTAAPTPPAGP